MKRRSVPVALLAVAISFGAGSCSDDGPSQSDDPGTTEPAGTTEPTDTSEPPATEAPGTNQPADTTDASVAEEEPTVDSATDALVGLTEDAATTAAEDHGWELRVIRRDGEDLPMTMDLRPNRVNVEVTDGEVTAVLQIG